MPSPQTSQSQLACSTIEVFHHFQFAPGWCFPPELEENGFYFRGCVQVHLTPGWQSILLWFRVHECSVTYGGHGV